MLSAAILALPHRHYNAAGPGSGAATLVRRINKAPGIADEQTTVRSALRAILARRINWEVCAEAKTGDETLALARQQRPDIVRIDLNLSGFRGFDAALGIKRRPPGVELIMLTSHYSKQLFYEVLKLGALGFVLKSDAERDLIPAVEAVWRREPYISRHLDALLPNSARNAPAERLSGRKSLSRTERAEVRWIADQIRQLL